MAEDWAADVKKFAPNADDTVISGIVRYCGIALQNRDSSLVSFGDPAETARVRDNYLKKKLGLTHADDVLEQAITAVGERMKGVNFKNRVTVYYLLAEHFGTLDLFGKAGAGASAAAGAAALGAAGLGAAGLTSAQDSANDSAAVAVEPTVAPAPRPTAPVASQTLTGGYGAADKSGGKSGLGWWPWLLLGLLLLGLVWWLFLRTPSAPEIAEPPAPADVVSSAPLTEAPVAAGVGTLAAAPLEGTVAIPTGAGVTAEIRDGKPVVKVYFDTGKTDLAPAFTDAATGLKDYLASHAGSSLAVSGFNDKSGDVAANAELSKNRAQAVKAALVAAGVAEASIELVKPVETTDTSTSNAAARRVEVVVR